MDKDRAAHRLRGDDPGTCSPPSLVMRTSRKTTDGNDALRTTAISASSLVILRARIRVRISSSKWELDLYCCMCFSMYSSIIIACSLVLVFFSMYCILVLVCLLYFSSSMHISLVFFLFQ